ncbi:MAG: RNA 2',3'-cyclic phosphodiesterase [Wenzhouxiangella sp.]|nr:MAG: RNA 2',3'-cyclic phosphodiesterase [Wenzhouxiangella sp.]
MTEKSEIRRLFFACWPDDEVRREIVARRRLIEGLSPRRVPDHNLHLTLLFLGDQPADRLADIAAAAGQITAPGCRLILDCFGWFPGARVAWLGGETPGVLAGLVDELKRVNRALGLAFDDRPFRPHVTLFRKIARRPDFPEPPPLNWTVSEFSLVESIPSRPYQVLRTWPLTL